MAGKEAPRKSTAPLSLQTLGYVVPCLGAASTVGVKGNRRLGGRPQTKNPQHDPSPLATLTEAIRLASATVRKKASKPPWVTESRCGKSSS